MMHIVLFWMSLVPLSSEARPKPYLMIAVGDSLTAGFLANTSAVKPSEPVSKSALSSDGFPKHNIPEWEIFLAQLLNRKQSLSWASGSKIESHAVKLEKYLKSVEPDAELVVKNVALSGGLSSDLDHQADQILNAWYSGKYRSIKYMTYLMGANDACLPWYDGGTPEAQMANSIRNFFKRLSVIHQDEPIRVLVSSLPKIPDLAKPEIFDYHVTPSLTCQVEDLRRNKYCVPLVNYTTPEGYTKAVATVERKNQLIEDVVTEVAKEYPQFEIVYSHSLFEAPVKLKSLARDCFHSNRSGHEVISDLLWKDQPWFHSRDILEASN